MGKRELDSQSFPPLRAASLQNQSASPGTHANPEPVRSFSSKSMRLKWLFHKAFLIMVSIVIGYF